MEYDSLQSKKWYEMLSRIEKFKNSELSYFELVYDLEGLLDACDIPQLMVEQWYDYWTPLEIAYATKGSSVSLEDIKHYLNEFQEFIERTLKDSFT